MNKEWLFHGTVFHKRFLPKKHAFRYPSIFICFPVSRISELKSRFFSINRFNLFSLKEADHGNGTGIQQWISTFLKNESVIEADGEIWLMTMPRILGFVFNPVSFWWCLDKSGDLRAMVCEVNNTFGERHFYLLMTADRGVITEKTELNCKKAFHVSPFFEVKGEYHFKFLKEDARRTASIDYKEDDISVLKTVVTGTALPISDKILIKTFMSFGLATLMVVIRINWQALKLFIKGIPFHKKPTRQNQDITR